MTLPVERKKAINFVKKKQSSGLNKAGKRPLTNGFFPAKTRRPVCGAPFSVSGAVDREDGCFLRGPGTTGRSSRCRSRKDFSGSGAPVLPQVLGISRTMHSSEARDLPLAIVNYSQGIIVTPPVKPGRSWRCPEAAGLQPSANTRSASARRLRCPLWECRDDPSLPRRFRRYRDGPR